MNNDNLNNQNSNGMMNNQYQSNNNTISNQNVNYSNMNFNSIVVQPIQQNSNVLPTNTTNNSNNKKKIIIIISIILIIALIVIVLLVLKGNNKNKDNDSREDQNNAQTTHHISDDIHENMDIEYIVYADRQINILDDFSDFINQFRGLGCSYKIPNINFSQKIDELDDNYYEQLMVPDYTNDWNPLWLENNELDILCNYSNYNEDTKFIIYFDKNDEDSQGMSYEDREIVKYKIKSSYETTSIVFNKSTINLSIFAKDKHTYNEIYEKIGQYNDWSVFDDNTSKITYYAPKYNISFYIYEKTEDDIKQKDIYLHEMDIEIT